MPRGPWSEHRRQAHQGELDGRAGAKHIAWSRAVIARDQVCQRCGAESQLVAHHVVAWDDDIERRFDVSNGLTVCRACHKVIHPGQGWRGDPAFWASPEGQQAKENLRGRLVALTHEQRSQGALTREAHKRELRHV
ncbi:MAG: HNH endonuclease [Chloroflexota bacterium]|nr:MAG: HNH endonuclease [Chloroflexota bacterium]